MESEEESIEAIDISQGVLRKEVFALVSSAENSTTDYTRQDAYIEDIGDGRGYTAGIIGFTTGTGGPTGCGQPLYGVKTGE